MLPSLCARYGTFNEAVRKVIRVSVRVSTAVFEHGHVHVRDEAMHYSAGPGKAGDEATRDVVQGEKSVVYTVSTRRNRPARNETV